jgi:hypothetical protein
MTDKPETTTTMTPASRPFDCAGFVAYLRGGNLSLDGAEMLARKFEQADAEIGRLREIEDAQALALRAAGEEIRKLRAALGLNPVIREPANV